ncbi:hypothetical protein L798_15677 [Zootermopsis nevadensis]|uniref:Uncharacterized protein n=1 Tax=Zootermopsis nevadensis TaxID=136037 RepID=A0A067QVQ4_ZOONE|nr:hypothetical protein L798_15677 [Zootermopsis nevadensis]
MKQASSYPFPKVPPYLYPRWLTGHSPITNNTISHQRLQEFGQLLLIMCSIATRCLYQHVEWKLSNWSLKFEIRCCSIQR